jgi:hypothetical protein
MAYSTTKPWCESREDPPTFGNNTALWQDNITFREGRRKPKIQTPQNGIENNKRQTRGSK